MPDLEWLREWATGEAEYPPKDLREQAGQLLDAYSVSQQIHDQLKDGRWDEIGIDIDLVDALGNALRPDIEEDPCPGT